MVGLTAGLSCQLDSTSLPTRVAPTASVHEGARPPQVEPIPLKITPAQLSPWAWSSPPPRDLQALRGDLDLRSLPTFAGLHHLCLGLSPDGPPTIAWRGSISPSLRLPLLPRDAQAVLLLFIDWDQPTHETWRRLNETYRGPLSSNSTLARVPHILWATLIPKEELSAWPSSRSGHTLPMGLGGQGNPFRARALARGTYQALNDYSDWFSHAPLRAPSRGYAGPCVPRLDPRPHQISALAVALQQRPDLPSEGSPTLPARRLVSLSLPHALAISRFDWQASLVHDAPELKHPLHP